VESTGLQVREAESHLELVDQKYDFIIPHLQWEHFLIAVAEKPA
jgi:hypothetical protein